MGIELENFMCHKKLRLNFNVEDNNCFYIIGPNGSGKSALFAGLNIGLGGTGRSNERGKTLQSYIKDGKSDARIRIFLSNKGDYALANFDEVIVIERHIMEKTALFTLKTCTSCGGRERIVSKKKAELDMLLEQFGIELENPLAWLSQDRCRQFLQQMKPEKLYQLYRKTSEMDSTDLVFQSIEAHFDEFCKILDSLDAEKKAREDNYLRMKNRHKAARDIKDKKVERQRLLWYQFWAPIRDNNIQINEISSEICSASTKKEDALTQIEQHMDAKNKLIKKGQSLLPQRDEELKKSKQHYDKIMEIKRKVLELRLEITDLEREVQKKKRQKTVLDNDLGEANAKLAKIIGEYSRTQEELKKSKQHYDKIMEMKRKVLELRLEITDLEREVQKKKRQKTVLDNDLGEANAKLAKIIGDSNRNITEEKQSLEEQCAEIAHQIASIEEDRAPKSSLQQEVNRKYLDKKKQLQDQSSELHRLERQKQQLHEEHNMIARSKVNRLALFGAEMPKLTQLIHANRTMFRRLPIGPIGNSVKLNDQKWANAVELHLKKMLSTFICDSSHDRTALDEICRLNGIKSPEIITAAFTDTKFDISGKEPPHEFLTIERVLDDIEPTIYNVLVDMNYVECTLLVERDDEARNIMYPHPPQNVSMAITQSCSQVYPARGRQPYRFFASHGQFHSRALAHRFLAQDPSTIVAQIRQIEQEILEKDIAKNKSEQHVRAAANALSEVNAAVSEFDRQLNQLTERRNSAEDELQKLDQLLFSGERIDNLQGAIREASRQRAICLGHLDEVHTKYTQKLEEQNEAKQRIGEAERKAAYLKNNVNQIESDIESCSKQQEKIAEKVQDFETVSVRQQNKITKLEEAIAELQSENTERQESIASMNLAPEHEEFPPDFGKIPPTAELQHNLKHIEQFIKLEENNHEPVPTIEDLKKKADDYKKFKEDHGVWARRKQKLMEMKNCRKRRFNLLKASLPQKIANDFMDNMNMRGFKSSLSINDERQLVEIRVEQPGECSNDAQADDDDGIEGGGGAQRRTGRDRRGGAAAPGTSSKRILQDLRGLSGGERSFTTVSFVMALWSCMESPFRCSDEFDVFMDPVNRRISMEMLARMAMERKHTQFFFFTPQSIMEMKNDELQIEVFELKRIAGLLGVGQGGDEEEAEVEELAEEQENGQK
uniref:SMC_N domain-containing protein n=1 Tax=Globodera pallida TaxID=36090 RepID=A0A183C5Y8_GLOPA